MNRLMLVLVGASILLSGCVSYNGIATATDEVVDESNRAYVAQAQKAFDSRMKAPPRPVLITEAPEMGIFLDTSRSFYSGGHPLCNSLTIRKEVAVAFKGQLRNIIGNIKDFKLVEENDPMIAVGDEAAPAPVYYLTYNITSLELKEDVGVSILLRLIGYRWWNGIVKVEVRLFKPDRQTSIFSFVGEGSVGKLLNPNNPPDKTFLLDAIKEAANNAMDGYVQKFGPPTYVTDTCQSGRFAKLNIGSKFGVQPDQRVEFYYNKVREGVSGESEVSRVVVGHGVVGKWNAPVEPNAAWVFVEDFDELHRQVFRWTSARILPVEK